MILVCVRTFGNFEPGNEVEVSDGAVFDASYFELKASNTEVNEDEDGEE